MACCCFNFLSLLSFLKTEFPSSLLFFCCYFFSGGWQEEGFSWCFSLDSQKQNSRLPHGHFWMHNNFWPIKKITADRINEGKTRKNKRENKKTHIYFIGAFVRPPHYYHISVSMFLLRLLNVATCQLLNQAFGPRLKVRWFCDDNTVWNGSVSMIRQRCIRSYTSSINILRRKEKTLKKNVGLPSIYLFICSFIDVFAWFIFFTADLIINISCNLPIIL